jgi:hypothetical protein
MYVVVMVSPEVASAIRSGLDEGVAGAIRTTLQTSGHSELKPMAGPGESLSEIFWIEVPDWESGRSVAERLRAFDGVEAAYVKPVDEMP